MYKQKTISTGQVHQLQTAQVTVRFLQCTTCRLQEAQYVAAKPRDAFVQHAVAWPTPKTRIFPTCVITTNLSLLPYQYGHNLGLPEMWVCYMGHCLLR